jgi:hypothetical protein
MDECATVLNKGADLDWSLLAGDLEWTCRDTLDHIALGVLGYAGLLIDRPTDRYITLFGSLDPAASIPACLSGLRIASTLLATTVRDAPAEVTAWHPWGHADRAGFAAMGVLETVVHTYDIARTFGFGWEAPAEVSAPVVERLFPQAPTGADPWSTLLWCTGRVALPGHERQTTWRWWGSPR